MKLIDLFKKLGIFVPDCYSRKYNRNILGAKIYISLKVGDITYNVPLKDVKGTTGEFDLIVITLQGESVFD